MATQRVIVLERQEGQRVSYRYALWADVPANMQPFYADPNRVSEWELASSADNDALKLGQVAEKVGVYSKAPGASIAEVQADLEAAWQAFQDEITGENKWDRYGTRWDGTTWTNDGVT